MARHEDHPFIKKIRQSHNIPDDANFLESVVPIFARSPAHVRQRDLAGLEAAQKYDTGLRSESQLASVTRRLRGIDAAMRDAKDKGVLND